MAIFKLNEQCFNDPSTKPMKILKFHFMISYHKRRERKSEITREKDTKINEIQGDLSQQRWELGEVKMRKDRDACLLKILSGLKIRYFLYFWDENKMKQDNIKKKKLKKIEKKKWPCLLSDQPFVSHVTASGLGLYGI